MTKTWLAFLGGGLCGAAMALGLTQFFPRVGDMRRADAASEGGAVGENRAAREAGETETLRGIKKTGPERGLADRVARLQAWTDARGGEPDTSDLYETLGDWAESDPYAALAWVKGAKRLPQRLQMLAVPLAALARNNPAEAVGWMRQNVDAHDRASVLEGVFGRLSMDDPREALELVMAFPEGDNRRIWAGHSVR